MRTPSRKTKSKKRLSKDPPPASLKGLIAATVKLWRKLHLTYDQARYVAKEARAALSITRVKTRKRVVQRLSRDEEQRLIQQAGRTAS
jgi:integrase/recombinase XerD